MKGPSQRPALGALFVVLAALFAVIALGSAAAADDRSSLLVVTAAAAAIAVWLASLAFRAFRARGPSNPPRP